MLNISNIWEVASYLLQILGLQIEFASLNTTFYCQLAFCFLLLQLNVYYLVRFLNLKGRPGHAPKHNQVAINYAQYLFQQTQMSFWQLVQFLVFVVINFAFQSQQYQALLEQN